MVGEDKCAWGGEINLKLITAWQHHSFNKLKACLAKPAVLGGLEFNSLCCQLKSEITTAVISSEFPDLGAAGKGRRGLFFSPSLVWLTPSRGDEGKERESRGICAI